MTFLHRLAICHGQFWLAIDQLLCVLLRAPWFLATGRNRPTAKETISAWTGNMAISGNWLALHISEPAINAFAWALGGGTNHCRRAAKFEAAYSTPVN
jgi:hypothetical protein